MTRLVVSQPPRVAIGTFESKDQNGRVTKTQVYITPEWWRLTSQLSISANSAGTVTNAAALTDHALLVGDGVDAIAALPLLTNGQLMVGVTGADPAPQTVSGDATFSVAGALTINNDAVTFAKQQNVTASKLVGRGSAAGTGDPEEITLGTNLTMTGTTLDAAGGSGITQGFLVWYTGGPIFP